MGKFEDLGKDVGSLVDKKNTAYGNSFDQAGEFLRLLYPTGMTPEQYGDALCLVRMFDKFKRIATDPNAFNEDPWKDLTGYSLLGLNRKNELSKASIPSSPLIGSINLKTKRFDDIESIQDDPKTSTSFDRRKNIKK